MLQVVRQKGKGATPTCRHWQETQLQVLAITPTSFLLSYFTILQCRDFSVSVGQSMVILLLLLDRDRELKIHLFC
jgi:hypothetical protein